MKPHWLHRVPSRWRAGILRLGFNWHPAWRASGGRVEYVAPDLSRMRVCLRLTRRTRNVVGTLFGGSLFAITDGPHPTLLMAALGDDVVVWDQEASIRYRAPGRSTLFADFVVTSEEVAEIRSALERDGETRRRYRVELRDRHGQVHTEVERTVYIAMKAYYKNKFTGGASTCSEPALPPPSC